MKRKENRLATTITRVIARDVRFPTSRELHGSDALNVDPDYSAAHVVLETDGPGGLAGHGLAFTTGRGTEVVVAAVRAYTPLVEGRTLESNTTGAAVRYSSTWSTSAAIDGP